MSDKAIETFSAAFWIAVLFTALTMSILVFKYNITMYFVDAGMIYILNYVLSLFVFWVLSEHIG